MGSDARFARDAAFGDILSHQLVEPVFQPVVALADERPVGFEALARGPEGRFHSAADLFAAAVRAGRSAELDWLCVKMAALRYQEADNAGCALFVNINPDTLATDPPDELIEAWAELNARNDVVLELTERAVIEQPARLLNAVDDARRRSARIALDDVGSEPASLVAMPLINPDIIKLDRSIIQSRSNSWAVSQVVNAVLDDAQRQGSRILAEGIERPEHVTVARSLGATLGQGWLFGRPGPLPHSVQPSEEQLPRVKPRHVSSESPFMVLSKTTDLLSTSIDHFERVAAHVENQAAQTANPGLLLVNLGDGGVDDEARIRQTYITNRGIEVFVFGTDVPRGGGGRIRFVPVAKDDPLARERTILFVGSRYGGAAFARRRTADTGEDYAEWGTCYNADAVIEAALALVHRL
jgi:EAL domain-containing protein (putative c-di-GMP-specific phosphodiesterase class I)